MQIIRNARRILKKRGGNARLAILFPRSWLLSSPELRRRINFSISALITILSFASFDLFEKFGNFPIVPVDRGRLHCTVQRPAKWRERERERGSKFRASDMLLSQPSFKHFEREREREIVERIFFQRVGRIIPASRGGTLIKI